MLDLKALYGIEAFAPIPLAECTIQKPYLLERAGISAERGSALLFLLPYYTVGGEGGNVSMYAVAEDYHRYCEALFADIAPRLSRLLPGAKFEGFADRSPIREVEAAAKAGLGIMGENGLLINLKYSSFVFIGGIYTDAGADAWEVLVGARPRGSYEPGRCPGCGECMRACPAHAILGGGHIDRERCFSAVTQKKKLADGDGDGIAGAEYVWGCDVCGLACPYTRAARAAGTLETPLQYFREKLIKTLDESTLSDLVMSGEFERRAFSWRGEDVVRRNLRLRKGKDHEDRD